MVSADVIQMMMGIDDEDRCSCQGFDDRPQRRKSEARVDQCRALRSDDEPRVHVAGFAEEPDVVHDFADQEPLVIPLTRHAIPCSLNAGRARARSALVAPEIRTGLAAEAPAPVGAVLNWASGHTGKLQQTCRFVKRETL